MKASSAKKPGKSAKSSASEVAPGVFVGSWKDAVAFDGKRYCVLDEPSDEEVPADEQIPIYDPSADQPIVENLDRLTHLVESARSRQEPVLLFCGHGIRRGPLAGAWYLHRHDGISLDEAYDRVRAVRPKTEHAKDWAGHWEVLLEDDPDRRPARKAVK